MLRHTYPSDLIVAFLVAFLFAVGCLVNVVVVNAQNDRDLPGFSGDLQTIASCSYVIPMDLEYQGGGGSRNLTGHEINLMNCNSSDDFNMRAYGLIAHLLWHDVPVKWIINSTKSFNGIDFCANTWEITPHNEFPPTGWDYNTTLVNGTGRRCFRGGPFIVDVNITNIAWPLIVNYTQTGPYYNVRVFRLAEEVTVDVRYFLTSRPYVAIFTSSGKQFVITSAFIDSGFTYYVEMNKDDAQRRIQSECLSMAIEPHFHAGDDQDYNSTSYIETFVNASKTFLNLGSNFFAQCGGISTYEQCDDENGDYLDGVNFNVQQGYYPPGSLRPSAFTLPYPYNSSHPATYFGNRTFPFCFTQRPTIDGYWRFAPPFNTSYCESGYTVTKGGFYLSPKPYEMALLKTANVMPYNTTTQPLPTLLDIYNATSETYVEYPGIPMAQWNTLNDRHAWVYSPGSVAMLTLFHPLEENYTTHLNQENAAHWLVYQPSNRDRLNDESIPPYNNSLGPHYYSFHYSAHAKLSKFHGQNGGNIFYQTGHMANSLVPKFDDGCTGPTAQNSSCKSYPGRRMLMNAVLTPSQRSCTVVVNGINKTLNIDPTYYIAQPSVKRYAEGSSWSPLPCGCKKWYDACFTCGGNVNESSECSKLLKGIEPKENITFGNTTFSGFGGPVDAVPMNQSNVFPASIPKGTDVLQILAGSNVDVLFSSPLSGSTILQSIATYPLGPVYFQLDKQPSWIIDAESEIKKIILNQLNASLPNFFFDPQRLNVTIVLNVVTVMIDGFDSNVATPSPTPTINYNNSDVVPVIVGINTNTTTPDGERPYNPLYNVYFSVTVFPGQCKVYIILINNNIRSVDIYTTILNQISNASTSTPTPPEGSLKICLRRDHPADLPVTDCVVEKPFTDNGETQIDWVAGTVAGKGYFANVISPHNKVEICYGNKLLRMQGQWYLSLCSSPSSEVGLTVSLSVNIIPTTNYVNYLNQTYNSAAVTTTSTISYSFVIFCVLLLLLLFEGTALVFFN